MSLQAQLQADGLRTNIRLHPTPRTSPGEGTGAGGSAGSVCGLCFVAEVAEGDSWDEAVGECGATVVVCSCWSPLLVTGARPAPPFPRVGIAPAGRTGVELVVTALDRDGITLLLLVPLGDVGPRLPVLPASASIPAVSR